MAAYSYNSCTQEANAGLLQVRGHHELCSEISFQKNNTKCEQKRCHSAWASNNVWGGGGKYSGFKDQPQLQSEFGVIRDPVFKKKKDKIAQWLNALTAKTGGLNSVLRTHMVKGKNRKPFPHLHVRTVAHEYVHTHTLKINKSINKCVIRKRESWSAVGLFTRIAEIKYPKGTS